MKRKMSACPHIRSDLPFAAFRFWPVRPCDQVPGTTFFRFRSPMSYARNFYLRLCGFRLSRKPDFPFFSNSIFPSNRIDKNGDDCILLCYTGNYPFPHLMRDRKETSFIRSLLFNIHFLRIRPFSNLFVLLRSRVKRGNRFP